MFELTNTDVKSIIVANISMQRVISQYSTISFSRCHFCQVFVVVYQQVASKISLLVNTWTTSIFLVLCQNIIYIVGTATLLKSLIVILLRGMFNLKFGCKFLMIYCTAVIISKYNEIKNWAIACMGKEKMLKITWLSLYMGDAHKALISNYYNKNSE